MTAFLVNNSVSGAQGERTGMITLDGVTQERGFAFSGPTQGVMQRRTRLAMI